MKFQLLIALFGLARAVQLSADQRDQTLKKITDDKLVAKDTVFHQLDRYEDTTAQQKDNEEYKVYQDDSKFMQFGKLESDEQGKPKQSVKKNPNIASDFTKHYGKTQDEIDEENQNILSYDVPDVTWRWDSTEEVWYRWYDGKWHYWGPSKGGFTYSGWSWYMGYWHHRGYVYKWENPYWYRFQDNQWVRYRELIPVYPAKPEGKICRPVYQLMEKGYPTYLSNKRIPRCQVGSGSRKQLYMYTGENGCRFLGGKKVMVNKLICKDGQQHRWKKQIKCIRYQLSNDGLDYKTGKLQSNRYKFNQCKLYRSHSSASEYLYLFGQCHHIPNQATKANLFASNAKTTVITTDQMQSCSRGKALKNGASLLKSDKGLYYLKNWVVQRIVNDAMVRTCQFDGRKAKAIKDESLKKTVLGDIIAP